MPALLPILLLGLTDETADISNNVVAYVQSIGLYCMVNVLDNCTDHAGKGDVEMTEADAEGEASSSLPEQLSSPFKVSNPSSIDNHAPLLGSISHVM